MVRIKRYVGVEVGNIPTLFLTVGSCIDFDSSFGYDVIDSS